MQAINEQSLRLLRLFGNTTSKKVVPSVGPEQEYFLVDAEKYYAEKRLDLTQDVRFSEQCLQKVRSWMIIILEQSVRESQAYMKDVNEELWKVGVSAKTQHNEVAPAQHELAPIYDRGKCSVRPQSARNADIKESCVSAWTCSACFMRNHLQESMVPVSMTTGQ